MSKDSLVVVVVSDTDRQKGEPPSNQVSIPKQQKRFVKFNWFLSWKLGPRLLLLGMWLLLFWWCLEIHQVLYFYSIEKCVPLHHLLHWKESWNCIWHNSGQNHKDCAINQPCCDIRKMNNMIENFHLCFIAEELYANTTRWIENCKKETKTFYY